MIKNGRMSRIFSVVCEAVLWEVKFFKQLFKHRFIGGIEGEMNG